MECEEERLQKVKSVPHFQWVTIRGEDSEINGLIERGDKDEVLKQ